jgi:hypothetical protein
MDPAIPLWADWISAGGNHMNDPVMLSVDKTATVQKRQQLQAGQ